MFLSMSWKVRTLYFSKYISEEGSVYFSTVYAYVTVHCCWEQIQWLCSVFEHVCTDLYLRRPGENQS